MKVINLHNSFNLSKKEVLRMLYLRMRYFIAYDAFLKSKLNVYNYILIRNEYEEHEEYIESWSNNLIMEDIITWQLIQSFGYVCIERLYGENLIGEIVYTQKPNVIFVKPWCNSFKRNCNPIKLPRDNISPIVSYDSTGCEYHIV